MTKSKEIAELKYRGFSGTILKRVWEGLDMEIRFNLSSDEFELLRECAEGKGVSMEILIREAILNEIEDDIDRRVDMLLTAREQLERDKVYGDIQVSDLLDI